MGYLHLMQMRDQRREGGHILGPSFFIFGVVFFDNFGSSSVFIFVFFKKKFFFDFPLSRFWHFGGGTLGSHRSSSSGFFSSLTLLSPFWVFSFQKEELLALDVYGGPQYLQARSVEAQGGGNLLRRSFVGRTEWHENSTPIRGIIAIKGSCGLDNPLDSPKLVAMGLVRFRFIGLETKPTIYL